MNEPKILSFDIETAGVNALRSDLGFVLMFGYKWLHEKKAHVLTLDRKSLLRFDDRKLLEQASKLIDEADLVVGHFASVFDRRFIQGRLLIHDMPPIPPVKMRDTCMIARSVANFSSNRLKNLAKTLHLHNQKTENDWPEPWLEVMQGNMKSLRKMADYCKHDVLAVEELYLRLRPFDNPHPRIVSDRTKCNICGGKVEYRGYAYVSERKYRRYVCTKCHKWGREGKAAK